MSASEVRISQGRRAGSGLLALLRAWRTERMPWMRFGPLAVLIAWAACSGEAIEAATLAIRCALAWMLLAQFRLWDDLVDRARDRGAHPERALARRQDVGAMAAACAVLGAANALALGLRLGIAAVALFAGLSAGLAAWYRCHAERGLLHAHVLLLKYPAFVLMITAPFVDPWAACAAMAAVYSSMCAFELLETEGATNGRLGMLAAHGGVLILAACGPHVDPASGIAAGLVAAIWVLALVCGPDLPARKYLPFLSAVVVLARITLGVIA